MTTNDPHFGHGGGGPQYEGPVSNVPSHRHIADFQFVRLDHTQQQQLDQAMRAASLFKSQKPT